MKSVCVFCGSSSGNDGRYAAAARELGKEIAAREIRLVYGGGGVGLMGHLAQSCLKNGGSVTGVIPRRLRELGVSHEGLTELIVVETMHERKAKMAELADGFVAMPGGLGTLEELTEILTWAQLGLHAKPCGLLNACGYYDRLVEFLRHAVREGFLNPHHLDILQLDPSPKELLEKLLNFKMPELDKASWILGLADKVEQ